jgi:DNA-binding IclR family transcriptional regulator
MLERVSAESGETADLAVVRATGLTYVDEVAPATVMTANWLGRAVPLHATSSGKAWLAWLPTAEAHALLAAPLASFTPTTITSLSSLDDELTSIRSRGYGTCRGEFESQLFGVSAPVLDDSSPVAVISVWGPSDRISEARFEELGRLVREAADELAQILVGAA